MAFNNIKGLDKLGVVGSVVGNERTLAANAAMRAHVHETRKQLAVPAKPKQVQQHLDPWTKELKRLGFVV